MSSFSGNVFANTPDPHPAVANVSVINCSHGTATITDAIAGDFRWTGGPELDCDTVSCDFRIEWVDDCGCGDTQMKYEFHPCPAVPMCLSFSGTNGGYQIDGGPLQHGSSSSYSDDLQIEQGSTITLHTGGSTEDIVISDTTTFPFNSNGHTVSLGTCDGSLVVDPEALSGDCCVPLIPVECEDRPACPHLMFVPDCGDPQPIATIQDLQIGNTGNTHPAVEAVIALGQPWSEVVEMSWLSESCRLSFTQELRDGANSVVGRMYVCAR